MPFSFFFCSVVFEGFFIDFFLQPDSLVFGYEGLCFLFLSFLVSFVFCLLRVMFVSCRPLRILLFSGFFSFGLVFPFFCIPLFRPFFSVVPSFRLIFFDL